jgi:hypothetical protein
MSRSKSGLLPPAEAAKAKEPETGPGSATCFCRRMDRRSKALEAHQVLRAGHGGQNVAQDGPKFADFIIGGTIALDDLCEALREKVDSGTVYRVRVAVVA